MRDITPFNKGKTLEEAGNPNVSDHVDAKKSPIHLTIPETAVSVVRASGDFGDKVAIAGFSVSNFGVFASSEQDVGLVAKGGTLAADLDGAVRVGGDLECIGKLTVQNSMFVRGDIQLRGADYAEDFSVADDALAPPGSVMVLDDDGGGSVRSCDTAYDRRVAGVVSGAGAYQPAVILDRQPGLGRRQPLALMGKVVCLADATLHPIAVGDMLTTSPTRGHAMKATDRDRAFGAVIGKALEPLAEGYGTVPILVALQ